MITDLSRGLSAPRRWRPSRLSGLRLWLAADRISGLADGDPVAAWSDLSGSGFDASQATGTKRPTFKVNVAGGRPGALYDNVDDVLGISTLDVGTANMLTVACRWSGTPAGSPLASDANNYGLLVLSGSLFHRPPGLTAVSVADAGLAAGTQIITVRRSGTSVDFFRNGAQIGATQTLGGNSSLTLASVGARTDGSQPLNGHLLEATVYNRVLSSAEQKQLERYLGSRYGVNVA